MPLIDNPMQNSSSPGFTRLRPVSDRRIELLAKKGILLENLGRRDEALETWLTLLALDPASLPAINHLGALLAAAGENSQARQVFQNAVEMHPADPMTRVNLANILIKQGEEAAARAHLEHALALDPNFRPAHAGLAFILPRLGETALAAHHGRIAFRSQTLVGSRFRGSGQPVHVLELISTRGGNVRLQNFLSDRIFQRTLIPAEFYDPSTPLPPHQLVVNAIGDADLCQSALAGALQLLEHTTAPVINHPAAVRATGREAIAMRLAQISGVVAARTITVARAQLVSPAAPALFAENGFTFPLLLRSPGFHGGEHFLRVASAAALPTALNQLPGSELLVIQHLDARSLDGRCRKYRVMTIGGQLYPLHCAVSHDWKIHFFSAEMADHPEHRAEDAAFLADMPTVLGPRAIAALHSIQTALALDYGGIDFALSSQGDVLLFEANATMVILPPGPEALWDYRRPAVERVCRAVHALLAQKAGVAKADAAAVTAE